MMSANVVYMLVDQWWMENLTNQELELVPALRRRRAKPFLQDPKLPWLHAKLTLTVDLRCIPVSQYDGPYRVVSMYA